MSDIARASSLNAAEIRTCAAAWLERRDGDDWIEADQAELDTWLAQSLDHRVEYWRLEAAWKRADRLGALRSANGEKARSSFVRKAGIAIVAALVLVGVISVAASIYLAQPTEKTYATAIGGHQAITLADGTHIELNTDTVLHARGRTIALERGEAFFEVKHDAAHPFTVTASGHRVTDLGTKFLVRDEGGHLEVALMEGRARFESTDAGMQPHSAVLSPGDDVVATANSMSVMRKSTHELAGELGWRQGVLVFDHTTLAAAATEFNRYNSSKLVIADAAARLTVVGTFRSNDIAAFADATQALFGLHIVHRGDETVITR
ncbi:MAG TPA: FecR domain-containing protein [Rhizomicrobium sp.]|jgi:transmembrane sensor|nr:FecR domain-containing protein [Rhizomicrobium sp.]